MWRFIQKLFVVTTSFFSCNPLKCVSINSQECKVRLEIINIHSNEPSFYPYSVKISIVVVVVIISMIHMQNYVFAVLVKTRM